ncbi:MAG: PilT/PilU family type 4a pilus ATPase [Gammaproteobacteria bacterium]
MDFNDYLKYMVEQGGSDLYLSTSAHPSVKVHGQLIAIDNHILESGEVYKIACNVISEEQRHEFDKTSELNFALSKTDLGRFRVNMFKQRGECSMVIRLIASEIPSTETLGLPPVLKNLVMEKRGLILFVGATGSGKSTSLAALINYRNENSTGHIITIEDPIEFTHENKRSIVNQREVGTDTVSYEAALKNTLRQAPDVILIGEIRSQDTMEHAIAFAETGHLCLSTLHANNANQALTRIINFFPEERREQLLLDISLNLRGIVSQRLIPTLDKKRAAAIEILIGSPLVSELIKRNEITGIKEVMQKSENIGMQTFDTALYQLYKQNKISLQEAIQNADSQNNLRLKISLDEGLKTTDNSNLSIKPDEDHQQH